MKALRIFLCVCLILVFVIGAFALTSCENYTRTEAVKLKAPVVVLSENVAQWSADPYALRFEISVDGELTYMENSSTSKKLTDGQTFKVRAVGDGEEFLTSDWSNSVTYTEQGGEPGTEPDQKPDPEPVTYTVTFYDEDGATVLAAVTVNEGETAVYNGPIPDKDDVVDSEQTVLYYVFEGWVSVPGATTAADLTNIRDNKSVYASYGAYDVVYIVTFLQADGKVDICQVAPGATATAPAIVDYEGYKFVRWSSSVENVSGDMLVEAVYEKLHKVTFLDNEGNVLKEEWVENGKAATAPAPVVVGDYEFLRWSENFDNVTSDLTVSAIGTLKTHTVTFVMPDGTLIDTQTVAHGFSASEPTYPEIYFDKSSAARTLRTFTAWDREFTGVTSDLEVRAVYDSPYSTDVPVIIVELINTVSGPVVHLYVYTSEPTELDALQIAISVIGNGRISVTDVQSVSDKFTTLQGTGSDNSYVLNNNTKTFTYAWTNLTAVHLNGCEELFTFTLAVGNGAVIDSTDFSVTEAEVVVPDGNGFKKETPVVIYVNG